MRLLRSHRYILFCSRLSPFFSSFSIFSSILNATFCCLFALVLFYSLLYLSSTCIAYYEIHYIYIHICLFIVIWSLSHCLYYFPLFFLLEFFVLVYCSCYKMLCLTKKKVQTKEILCIHVIWVSKIFRLLLNVSCSSFRQWSYWVQFILYINNDTHDFDKMLQL